MVTWVGNLAAVRVRDSRYCDMRRPTHVALTAAGRTAQARAEEAVDAHALEFFGRISEAQRQELESPHFVCRADPSSKTPGPPPGALETAPQGMLSVT
jgi:hypothetical protein